MRYTVIAIVVVVALVTLYLIMKPKAIKDSTKAPLDASSKSESNVDTKPSDVQVIDEGTDTGLGNPADIQGLLPKPLGNTPVSEGGYSIALKPGDFNTVLPR